MSVGTSVAGMLPPALVPGSGSGPDRRPGRVVGGGLVVSTAFTLFLVPALVARLGGSLRSADRSGA